ncbi:MAG: hypothetical protein CMJ64_29570 [Planctomycetaceae bacterium]|nr:hypothetical protein [Planctomycetaceae bacterium]
MAKPGSWSSNPLASLYLAGKSNALVGLVGVLAVSVLAFGIGSVAMGRNFSAFAKGFGFVFLGATLAYVLAGQKVVTSYNLGYALRALAVGPLVSNTIRTPQ